MKDVRVDSDGDLRCPKCGAKAFRAKRSFKAKAMLVPTVGVGTLAAPKRLKCLACGELLKAGNAKPLTAAPGPSASLAAVSASGTYQVVLGRGGSTTKISRWLALHTSFDAKSRNEAMAVARRGGGATVLSGLSEDAARLRASELRAFGADARVEIG